jgi:3-oxoacyl-[acyl-carrier protein] reductase
MTTHPTTQKSSAAARLTGKVALVTGAASGMGLATAERLTREGARVALVDINAEAVRAAAARVGVGAIGLAADVCDADAVARAVERTVAELGPIDVFHNNAGVAEAVTPVADIGRGEWDRILAVNLTAFFLGVQAVVPGMRAAGGGSIILTGTIATRRPRAGLAAYVASKCGAVGLARQLAVELAPDRIRVNVINPGPALTPMLDEFRFGEDHDAVVDALSDALPLGRAIESEDIAAAAAYLASDDARSVTGVVLNVDSGRDL